MSSTLASPGTAEEEETVHGARVEHAGAAGRLLPAYLGMVRFRAIEVYISIIFGWHQDFQ